MGDDDDDDENDSDLEVGREREGRLTLSWQTLTPRRVPQVEGRNKNASEELKDRLKNACDKGGKHVYKLSKCIKCEKAQVEEKEETTNRKDDDEPDSEENKGQG